MVENPNEEYIPESVEMRVVKVSELKPHPQNYRDHPDDQLEHICQSIREQGIYRNLVCANDFTILAGHGVIQACRKMNVENVLMAVMPYGPDDVRAIKLLTGDNEISRMGMVDDRKLSELLRTVKDQASLLGTGYDPKMLANLVFVSRPASEIGSINEAAEWAGMPEFQLSPSPIKTIISFDTEEHKREFYALLGIEMNDKHTDSIWWPEKERMDLVSVKVEVPDQVPDAEKMVEPQA